MECAKGTINKIYLDNRQLKVIQWLSAPDPSINYNKALQQRHKGSGLWLLQSKAFVEWKARSNSFLWLHGISGCGKTILSSTIIEDLSRNISSSQFLLYFYFDFSDINKQSHDSMIRSLISQLYYKSEITRQGVDRLFPSSEGGCRQPEPGSLCGVFLDAVKEVDTWIVLDALDECNTRQVTRTYGLLSWIRDLLGSELSNVHLLVTSRPEPDIQAVLNDRAREEDIISIQSGLVSDVHAYIRARVREDNGLRRWRERPEAQDEIETQLAAKADGMFRWAACQVDALEKCYDYRTLQNALTSLPTTLDETYARILHSIPSEHEQKTIRILQLLAFSERPLRLEEAVDAIAVETEASPMFSIINRMLVPGEILNYCSSLAVLVPAEDRRSGKETKELRLAHVSVKEYLTSNRLGENLSPYFKETAARASIAKVCLVYMIHLDQDLQMQLVKEIFPLAQYCAKYWMAHATVAGDEDKLLQELILDFFLWRKSSYTTFFQLYNPDQPWNDEPTQAKPAAALYYASLGGFSYVVEGLIEQGADVNAQGGEYGNALQVASSKGHDKVVQKLLARNADVNAQSQKYVNALYAASEMGYEKIVQMLLEKDINVNAQGGEYGSAL